MSRAAKKGDWKTYLAAADSEGMRLYEADVSLQLALLALAQQDSSGTKECLGTVRRLVNQLGYFRLATRADEIEAELNRMRSD